MQIPSPIELSAVEELAFEIAEQSPAHVSPNDEIPEGEGNAKVRRAALVSGPGDSRIRNRRQFLTEMYVVEAADPTWTRPRDPNLYDVPLLTFET